MTVVYTENKKASRFSAGRVSTVPILKRVSIPRLTFSPVRIAPGDDTLIGDSSVTSDPIEGIVVLGSVSGRGV